MTNIKNFVVSATLLDVFLRSQSGTCHVLPQLLNPPTINLNFDFKAGAEKVKNEKVLLVITSLKVTATDKETNELKFDIFSEYVLAYDYSNYSGKIDEKLFQEFARTTGIFNAYPYLREAIQTITAKMGIPPVIAPLLKIEPPKKVEEKKVATHKTIRKRK